MLHKLYVKDHTHRTFSKQAVYYSLGRTTCMAFIAREDWQHPEAYASLRELRLSLTFQLFQIPMRAAQHPDREREFEVRVCNSDILVEYALDRFLRPRAVLHTTSQPIGYGGDEATHRSLSGHHQSHSAFYGLGMGVLRVHERHRRPTGLDYLRILVLYPSTQFA